MYQKRFSLLLPYNEHGEVLMQRRALTQSTYGEERGFFGGKMEDNEESDECAKRELLEELCLENKTLFRCGGYSLLGDANDRYLNMLYTFFISKDEQITIKEGDDAVRMSQEKARGLKLASEKLLPLFDCFESRYSVHH